MSFFKVSGFLIRFFKNSQTKENAPVRRPARSIQYERFLETHVLDTHVLETQAERQLNLPVGSQADLV